MQFQPAASTASTFLAFSSDNFVSNRALVGIDGSASSIWAVGGVAYSLNIGTVDSNSICFGASNAELYRIAPSGVFNWYNGAGGTRMTLDSTGLGIGVTPSAWNSDYKPIDIGANGCIAGRVGNSNTLDIISNGFRNAAGNYVYKSAVSAPAARYLLDGSTGSHIWFSGVAGTAGNTIVGFTTAAMTLDASGNLLVGTTDATQTSGVGTKILGSGLGPYVVNPAIANSALAYTMYSTGAAAYRFYVGWAGTVFATNTTISAISDARLKENVQDLDVGLNAILALKPRKFDWKEGKGKNIKGDRGFIAQEFETVFPNLIDEWADPAPEGEAPYKSVRQDLIPVLVKAIQELTARVQTLEAR